MAWPFQHQTQILSPVPRGNVARLIGNGLMMHLLTQPAPMVELKMLVKVTMQLEVVQN